MLSGILFARVERPVAATVSHFVESYQAVSSSGTHMSVWERFLYSLALSKQPTAAKKCVAANLVTHL